MQKSWIAMRSAYFAFYYVSPKISETHLNPSKILKWSFNHIKLLSYLRNVFVKKKKMNLDLSCLASQCNSIRSTRCQLLPALTRYQERPASKQTLLAGDCSVFTAAHAPKQVWKKDHSEPSFIYLFLTSGVSLKSTVSFWGNHPGIVDSCCKIDWNTHLVLSGTSPR